MSRFTRGQGDNVIFNCWYGSEGQCTSLCQILHQPVKPLPTYGHFLVCKIVAVHILGFLNVWNLNWQHGLEAKVHPMPNFTPIGQAVPEVWRFFFFQNGCYLPSWICYTHVSTTHKEYLLVSVTVQNLVGSSSVVFTISKSKYLAH